MTQPRASKPVKFGTVSAQVMAQFLDSHTPEYPREDAWRQFVWDMASAINMELRELAASGCRVIQVEEPTIHFTAAYTPEDRETLEFLVYALNHEISGLEECEVWIHTCWGNPMMQRVYDKTPYREAMELYLDRVNCDVWTVEMKDRGGADLELFENLARDAAQEDRDRRGQSSPAPGGAAPRGCPSDPQRRKVHRSRQADRLLGLWLRAVGPWPRARVLQGRGAGDRGKHRPSRAWTAETYVPAADQRLEMDYVPPTYVA